MHNVFSARLSNSLEVLESLEGDCTEHSVLFIGLARAVGLPAREVAGLIYVEGSPPGFYFHQWASIWLGEWVDVDPTFNQLPVDVTHIKLSEGDWFRQAKILPLIGRMKIKVLAEPMEKKSGGEPAPNADR
ncbi:MAG: Transglutaminase-like superfamily protein [Candidatus Hydrogenedentes bacterium ADurb.Bin179]|nr:MAG: Transglutaminase-like superfamily protein [Candidatus Hydrogenedentes bacterium ADurb.Bin179]